MAKFTIEYTNGDVEEISCIDWNTVEDLVHSKFGGVDHGHKVTLEGEEKPVTKASKKSTK